MGHLYTYYFLCSISFAVRQHGDISLHLSCWKEKPCPLTSFFYIMSILPGITHRGEHLWISHTVLLWCKFKRAAGTWRSQVAFNLLRRSMITDYHISSATLPSCWYSSVESSADELFWLLTHHRGRPVTVLWTDNLCTENTPYITQTLCLWSNWILLPTTEAQPLITNQSQHASKTK